jgi:hypothetical protein
LKVFYFFDHNLHIVRSQEKMLLGIFCSHEKVLPGKFKFYWGLVIFRNVKFIGIKKINSIFGQLERRLNPFILTDFATFNLAELSKFICQSHGG